MSTLILGGGISGLSSAYYLSRLCGVPGSQITLLEASKRLGGCIQTVYNKDNNGLVFETGPRTMRPQGVSAGTSLRLLEALGLGESIIPVLKTSPAARRRLICVNNQLHPLPAINSIGSLFKKSPPFTDPLWLMALRDLTRPSTKVKDESVRSFIERRFGDQAGQWVADPMVRGICGGDADRISVKLIMKSIFEGEQEFGSAIWAATQGHGSEGLKWDENEKSELIRRLMEEQWSVFSLAGGMEQLVDALADNVQEAGVTIRTETPCDRLVFPEPDSDDRHVTATIAGAEEKFDQVVAAIPARNLSSILDERHQRFRVGLDRIELASMAVVNVAYDRKVITDEAFGFLVPSSERNSILGVIYDTCSFPQGDKTVLTVMMGGRWFDELFGDNHSDEHLLSVARSELKAILGDAAAAEPISSMVTVRRDAIPQHNVGHYELVAELREYASLLRLPLAVVGSSYDGISVNDCIYHSRRQAKALTGVVEEGDVVEKVVEERDGMPLIQVEASHPPAHYLDAPVVKETVASVAEPSILPVTNAVKADVVLTPDTDTTAVSTETALDPANPPEPKRMTGRTVW